MEKITRVQMIQRIAQKARITNKAAAIVINEMFDIIHETISQQQTFVIPRVASLTGYLRHAKMGIDPRNGTVIQLKDKLIVKSKSYYKMEKIEQEEE